MKERKGSFARGLALTLCAFAVLFAGVFALSGRIGDASREAETELVSDAVRSAVVTCYAVEGGYPSELGYLKEHYGLAFDEDTYMVIYEAFASNIMPDIRVLERGAGNR